MQVPEAMSIPKLLQDHKFELAYLRRCRILVQRDMQISGACPWNQDSAIDVSFRFDTSDSAKTPNFPCFMVPKSDAFYSKNAFVDASIPPPAPSWTKEDASEVGLLCLPFRLLCFDPPTKGWLPATSPEGCALPTCAMVLFRWFHVICHWGTNVGIDDLGELYGAQRFCYALTGELQAPQRDKKAAVRSIGRDRSRVLDALMQRCFCQILSTSNLIMPVDIMPVFNCCHESIPAARMLKELPQAHYLEQYYQFRLNVFSNVGTRHAWTQASAPEEVTS